MRSPVLQIPQGLVTEGGKGGEGPQKSHGQQHPQRMRYQRRASIQFQQKTQGQTTQHIDKKGTESEMTSQGSLGQDAHSVTGHGSGSPGDTYQK